jgi:hypothetical protein
MRTRVGQPSAQLPQGTRARTPPRQAAASLLGNDHVGERTRPLDRGAAEHFGTHAQPSDVIADGLDDAGEVIAHPPREAPAGHHLHRAVPDPEVHRVGGSRPHPNENILGAEFPGLEVFEPHDLRSAIAVVLNSLHRGHVRSPISDVVFQRCRAVPEQIRGIPAFCGATAVH